MDRAVFGEETFRPERWIERAGPSLASFGFGRRICLDQHIANDIVAITIAGLLWAFEIAVSADPRAIDTESSTLSGCFLGLQNLTSNSGVAVFDTTRQSGLSSPLHVLKVNHVADIKIFIYSIYNCGWSVR